MNSSEAKLQFFMYCEKGDGRIVNNIYDETSMGILEITSGKVSVQIGTSFINAKKGDFIYIPRNMMSCVYTDGGEASVRGIIFDTSILEENMDNFDTEVFYMFYVQTINKSKVFGEEHKLHPILSSLMQNCYDEYMTKDICYKLPLRANIYLMMTVLLRHYCGSKDETDTAVYHNVLRLRPAIEYINEHYTEKIYIEQLSFMINVSKDYFTKMFKESMGKTPIDYINGLRINKAMYILSTTDWSLEKVSEEIGFCNANYFHKIFKQYTDTSPNIYRKRFI